ncbi:hypothetical protein GCM10010251_82760 [Streptomyces aurantiogriseus]|uniref:Uncharacterized protein n=1 Tax=Streptomyces aurantiogriseus TaxID=66870 RepID=A0A918KZ93_9ACTN|nr:hypothetical protein GCM10010251_82760 [Streptomyces aurantiogriseus]
MMPARAKRPLAGGGGEVVADRAGAGGLARDGHVPLVAAEAGDVGVHPAQGGLLVQEAVVAGAVLVMVLS